MRYFAIEPEAPGIVGDDAILDTVVHPPKVLRGEIELNSWFGDDIVECYPIYAVSSPLAVELRSAALTGYSLHELSVSVDPDGFNADDHVPTFEMLTIEGLAGSDDVGRGAKNQLVVSERFVAMLRKYSIAHAELTEWDSSAK